ncbi:hypothetical protein SAMN05444166_4246 [Singulisphaera sp. GP187]|uniref:hypothetical protein n=1 Tax=Singulisphaera sp. GP187 TaxID=1882752 RepID=UPI000928F494|nr:hypothetical protein [Singulisphaera sp. GP187]SIO38168.1 hypothetical protein SAMN05444166_4246 [Singulisphaera sp. GP187]
MSDLLSTTLGAVGAAGEALDKVTGGRALRGALAGKPRELMSFVPFSDSMGLTNEKDKTTGRDLTDAYGLTRKGDDSLGSHAAGFLADTIASPLSLASGVGAFRAAPTLAKGITQGAKAVTGLDLLDHVGAGAKKLGSFVGDEAGSLHVNDSLLKHLPWADRTDISDEVRNAAAWAGPQYPGGRDKLADAISGHKDNWRWIARSLEDHPGLEKIANEIPEGTKFLGNGAEAIALKSPQGHVIRVSPNVSDFGSAGRADIQEILQPFRSIEIPGDSSRNIQPWIVEHLPRVNPVMEDEDKVRDLLYRLNQSGNPAGSLSLRNPTSRALYSLEKSALGLGDDLAASIRRQHSNLNPWDFHRYNVATTAEGNALGHDGGMVNSFGQGVPPIRRYSPSPATPEALSEAARMGGTDAVREALERGIATGSKGQGVAAVGSTDLASIFADQKILRDFLSTYGHLPDQGPTRLPGVSGFVNGGKLSSQEVPTAFSMIDALNQSHTPVGGGWPSVSDLERRLSGGIGASHTPIAHSLTGPTAKLTPPLSYDQANVDDILAAFNDVGPAQYDQFGAKLPLDSGKQINNDDSSGSSHLNSKLYGTILAALMGRNMLPAEER